MYGTDVGITKKEREGKVGGRETAFGRVWSRVVTSVAQPSIREFCRARSADPDDARGDEDGAQGEAGR